MWRYKFGCFHSLRTEKTGLISKLECEDSKVSNEEAQTFLQGESEPQQEEQKDEPAEDVDDLVNNRLCVL